MKDLKIHQNSRWAVKNVMGVLIIFFLFVIQIQKNNKPITNSFAINSLTFLTPKGDTIPYTLSYSDVYHTLEGTIEIKRKLHINGDSILYNIPYKNFNHIDYDTISLIFPTKSLIFRYIDSLKPYNYLFVHARSNICANSVRVYYDIEINGKQLNGKCWYRRKIYIDPKVTFTCRLYVFEFCSVKIK